jgi:hypothetical protein
MTKHFHIERLPWAFDLGLYLTAKTGDGKFAIALPVQMKVLTDEETMSASHAPICDLRKDEAQQLMDELWRAGLRPSEGSGSAGSLAATERHLADMRALVFKLPPLKGGSDHA